jgi:hypothetical protein
MAESPDGAAEHLRALIDKVVQSRIDANRRYIDEVLEKIQDENHRYYLERLATESRMLEAEERAGNLHAVFYHKVMVDTYRSILEKTYGIGT